MSSPIEKPEFYYQTLQYSPHGLAQQLNHAVSPTATPPLQQSPPVGQAPIYQYRHPHFLNYQHSTGVFIPEAQHGVSSSGYRHPVSSPPMISPPHTHTHLDPSPKAPPSEPSALSHSNHNSSFSSPLVQTDPQIHSESKYHPQEHSRPDPESRDVPLQRWTGSMKSEYQHQQQGEALPLTANRNRRRSGSKQVADVKYPINYPAHTVPVEMQVPTGPPGGWSVMPPSPEDIRPRRYASGVDERNYFTVLEYEINSQAIIWDYYTGYVHLTGIWKAIGNSKADIVKLLDNSPELEPVIKRVRGGFLKIQGTWVPFDVARRLATHVCYYIRFALVPLFGPDFPEQCTKPNEAGFGMLQLNTPTENREHSTSNHSHAPSSPNSAKPRTLAPMGSVHQLKPQHHSLHGSHVLTSHGTVHGHHHSRQNSDNGFKKRGTSLQMRSNSLLGRREAVRRALPVNHETFDENAIDDEENDYISPPPMPRKVSFTGEKTVSESPSEFLAMLKATRSLQQISAGRPVKDVGGGFECAGRQFIWDGSDRLDVISTVASAASGKTSPIRNSTPPRTKSSEAQEILPKEQPPQKPEPTPPTEITLRRSSLAKILNT